MQVRRRPATRRARRWEFGCSSGSRLTPATAASARGGRAGAGRRNADAARPAETAFDHPWMAWSSVPRGVSPVRSPPARSAAHNPPTPPSFRPKATRTSVSHCASKRAVRSSSTEISSCAAKMPAMSINSTGAALPLAIRSLRTCSCFGAGIGERRAARCCCSATARVGVARATGTRACRPGIRSAIAAGVCLGYKNRRRPCWTCLHRGIYQAKPSPRRIATAPSLSARSGHARGDQLKLIHLMPGLDQPLISPPQRSAGAQPHRSALLVRSQ